MRVILWFWFVIVLIDTILRAGKIGYPQILTFLLTQLGFYDSSKHKFLQAHNNLALSGFFLLAWQNLKSE